MSGYHLSEKMAPLEIENAIVNEDYIEKGVEKAGDYSGAVSKTDPREIALVRKLDWRLMPTLWVMYFL